MVCSAAQVIATFSVSDRHLVTLGMQLSTMMTAHAVPCHRRADAVEGYDEATEQLLETDAGGDGWVSTAEASSSRTGHDTAIPDLDDDDQHAAAHTAADADSVPDIDDLAIEDEDDEASSLPVLHIPFS